MNPNLTGFMDALSLLVPFDLVVTSGIRSARGQASAMFTKIELGEILTNTYRDQVFARAVMAAYPNLELATVAVEEMAARGGSRHLIGRGLDIRTRGLSTKQRNELKAAIEGMGEYALYETTPPHMHISLNSKKNYGPINWTVLAAVTVGVYLWMRKPTRGA
mgnify:CR=1 FL=1